MEQAQSDIERYIKKMREYFDCLAMERDDATLEAKRVIREWNDTVMAYNTR